MTRFFTFVRNDKKRKLRNVQNNVKKKTLRNDIVKKKEWYEEKTTGIIRLIKTINPSHLKVGWIYNKIDYRYSTT